MTSSLIPQSQESVDAAVIQTFCQESVGQIQSFWIAQYKEDPEKTMKAIRFLAKHRSEPIECAINIVACLVIGSFYACFSCFFSLNEDSTNASLIDFRCHTLYLSLINSN